MEFSGCQWTNRTAATCRCVRPPINTVSAIKKVIPNGPSSCCHASIRSFRY
jgi:hypothetical protein